MRFLLLDGMDDGYLRTFLGIVLEPLGTLSVASSGLSGLSGSEEPDGLIIIDATGVEKIEKTETLVARLRLERPERRIVVVTASPTWQRARAAFEAGAIDYLPKTLTAEEMREAFRRILRKPLPR